MSEAVVDVHKGTIVSEKPVWVKLNGALINGQKLEVREYGNVIRFTAACAMVVQPDQVNAQTARADEAADFGFYVIATGVVGARNCGGAGSARGQRRSRRSSAIPRRAF